MSESLRTRKIFRHLLGLIQYLFEQASKPDLLKAVTMFLAAKSEHGDESLEASTFLIEGVACYLYQLWQVFIRDVADKYFPLLSQSRDDGGGKAEGWGGKRFQHLLLILLKSLQEA